MNIPGFCQAIKNAVSGSYHFQRQLGELLGADLRWRAGQETCRLQRLRECHYIPYGFRPCHYHYHAVEAECDAAVRRSAILQRV